MLLLFLVNLPLLRVHGVGGDHPNLTPTLGEHKSEPTTRVGLAQRQNAVLAVDQLLLDHKRVIAIALLGFAWRNAMPRQVPGIRLVPVKLDVAGSHPCIVALSGSWWSKPLTFGGLYRLGPLQAIDPYAFSAVSAWR